MSKVQKHAIILACVLLVWVAAHAAIKPTQGTGRIIEDFKTIPLHVEGWSGIDGKFDQTTIDALPHCALLTRDYENERGYDTNVSIVYGVDLGDFHQPEACMEGQGWRRTTSIPIEVQSKEPHKAIMLTMANDYESIVVVYWFASKGVTTTALGGHKMAAFTDRLKKGELKPSAMIRIITPVQGDLETTKQVTLDIAATIDPYINKMLSKTPEFEDSGKFLLEE